MTKSQLGSPSLYTAIRATPSDKSVNIETFYISATTNNGAGILTINLFEDDLQRIFITDNDALGNDAPVVIAKKGLPIESITQAAFKHWVKVKTTKTFGGGEELPPMYIEVVGSPPDDYKLY